MGTLTPAARRGAAAAHRAAERDDLKALLLEALADPDFRTQVNALLRPTPPPQPRRPPAASARDIRTQRLRGTRG